MISTEDVSLIRQRVYVANMSRQRDCAGQESGKEAVPPLSKQRLSCRLTEHQLCADDGLSASHTFSHFIVTTTCELRSLLLLSNLGDLALGPRPQPAHRKEQKQNQRDLKSHGVRR